MLMWPFLHDPRLGAYTELFAGCSEALTVEREQGGYIVPWGRVHSKPREDLLGCLKSKDEGGRGAGTAEKVWEWCEEVTREWS